MMRQHRIGCRINRKYIFSSFERHHENSIGSTCILKQNDSNAYCSCAYRSHVPTVPALQFSGGIVTERIISDYLCRCFCDFGLLTFHCFVQFLVIFH